MWTISRCLLREPYCEPVPRIGQGMPRPARLAMVPDDKMLEFLAKYEGALEVLGSDLNLNCPC
jgi:hypothetical protein